LNGAAAERDDERRRFRWALTGLTVVFSVIALVACGGSEANPVAPTTPAAPPAPRVIQQGTFTLGAPEDDGYFFGLTTITDPSSGRWDATVDWGSEANTLWMWVADGVCSAEQFKSDGCPFDATCTCRFAIRSETATPKPRVLTIPGAAGGSRTLIIMNLGPREETGQYRVTLTPSNGVTSSGPYLVTAAAGSRSGMSTERKTLPSRR
jgi:hypothetical protein